jgi:hypothetical protein
MLKLRLIVVDPPAGVTMAMQRGRDGLVSPTLVTENTLVFTFSVTVADETSDPVRLTGEFAQGPADSRFVYVRSGTLAGQSDSSYTCRAKVPLTGIDRAIVQAARAADVPLVAHVAGKSPKGGPFVASVKLLSPWQ